MSDAKITITGLAELETKLLALGQEIAAKAIVQSAYSAAKTIETAAEQNLVADGSIRTGLLKSAITRKKKIYAANGVVVIVTGVSKKISGTDERGNRVVPWRYAHLVEGHTKFMSRAGESQKQIVVDKFLASIKRKIKKYTT